MSSPSHAVKLYRGSSAHTQQKMPSTILVWTSSGKLYLVTVLKLALNSESVLKVKHNGIRHSGTNPLVQCKVDHRLVLVTTVSTHE